MSQILPSIKFFMHDCKIDLKGEFIDSYKTRCEIEVCENADLKSIIQNETPSIVFIDISKPNNLEVFLKISATMQNKAILIGWSPEEIDRESLIDFFDAGMSDYLLSSFAPIVTEARIHAKLEQLILSDLIGRESDSRQLAATSEQKSELAKSLFKMVLKPIEDIIAFSERPITKDDLNNSEDEMDLTIKNCEKISEIIIFARQVFGSFHSSSRFTVESICNLSFKLVSSNNLSQNIQINELENTNLEVDPNAVTPLTLAFIEVFKTLSEYSETKSINLSFANKTLEISGPEVMISQNAAQEIFSENQLPNSLILCKKMLEKHAIEIKLSESMPLTFKFIFTDIK